MDFMIRFKRSVHSGHQYGRKDSVYFVVEKRFVLFIGKYALIFLVRALGYFLYLRR